MTTKHLLDNSRVDLKTKTYLVRIYQLDLVKTMKKTEQPMERTSAIIIQIRIFTGELDHNGGLLDHFFADPVDPPASIMAKWLLVSLSGSLDRQKRDF